MSKKTYKIILVVIGMILLYIAIVEYYKLEKFGIRSDKLEKLVSYQSERGFLPDGIGVRKFRYTQEQYEGIMAQLKKKDLKDIQTNSKEYIKIITHDSDIEKWNDGELTKLEDGWYAVVDTSPEGRILADFYLVVVDLSNNIIYHVIRHS